MPEGSDVDEVALQLGSLHLHIKVKNSRSPAEPKPVLLSSSRATLSSESQATPGPATTPDDRAATAEDGWRRREAAAEAAGLCAGRIIRGEPWGEAVPRGSDLSNARWVVLRTLDSVVCDPPLVFRRWGDARPLVQAADGRLGRASLVQGFPSDREARIYVMAAGYLWPTQ